MESTLNRMETTVQGLEEGNTHLSNEVQSLKRTKGAVDKLEEDNRSYRGQLDVLKQVVRT